MVDRATGKLYRNDQAHERVRSASIVKVAIASYYLQPGGPNADYSTLAAMITQSDNASAYALFDGVGEKVIGQLAKWDTRVQYSPWWGHTKVTAAGQAKFLAALADGDVLPARPTRMLLALMRHVDSSQRWGLSEAVPGRGNRGVPVKNGWYAWGDLGTSSINCLALLPLDGQEERIAVAVTTSFPSSLGLGYGRATCRQVGKAFTAAA